MVSLPSIITDPVYRADQPQHALDRFFARFINDERDLPFIYLSLRLTFTVVLSGVLLFTPLLEGWYWWALAIFHVVHGAYWIGPFMLMLHNTSHNKFFKQEYSLLNYYIPIVVGLFFGQTPETYYSHHIGMHHAENNLEHDKSSTMAYQRDSLRGFLTYYFRFMVVGIKELAEYFVFRKKFNFLKMALRGETAFFVMVAVLGWFNWPATLLVFVFPLIGVRFGMMAGNWGQHAFIDARDPGNSYVNSITCINSVYNQRCFNDGYHIGHHVRPRLHWTEMPNDFRNSVEKYVEQGSIVFEKVDFFAVWFLLMTKQYRVLARHYVNIGNRFSSEEEVIAFLKERTRKLSFDGVAMAH
jgi:fatty acid desaturase